MAISPPVTLTSFDGVDVGATSSAVDTRPYDLIALLISSYTDGAYTVTDSQSNTWAAGTRDTGGNPSPNGSSAQIYYSYDVTKREAAHTFTISGAVVYPTCFVVGIKGVKHLADPKDTSTASHTDEPGTTVQAGSITPAENYEILLSVCASGGTVAHSSVTIAGNAFTKWDGWDHVSGRGLTTAVAYVIQSAAAAANPTWTSSGSTIGYAASNIAFKQASGGSLPLIGVGA